MDRTSIEEVVRVTREKLKDSGVQVKEGRGKKVLTATLPTKEQIMSLPLTKVHPTHAASAAKAIGPQVEAARRNYELAKVRAHYAFTEYGARQARAKVLEQLRKVVDETTARNIVRAEEGRKAKEAKEVATKPKPETSASTASPSPKYTEDDFGDAFARIAGLFYRKLDRIEEYNHYIKTGGITLKYNRPDEAIELTITPEGYKRIMGESMEKLEPVMGMTYDKGDVQMIVNRTGIHVVYTDIQFPSTKPFNLKNTERYLIGARGLEREIGGQFLQYIRPYYLDKIMSGKNEHLEIPSLESTSSASVASPKETREEMLKRLDKEEKVFEKQALAQISKAVFGAKPNDLKGIISTAAKNPRNQLARFLNAVEIDPDIS